MRIGEFEFTDHGNRLRMKYVGPKRYLTTASPDDNWWFDKLRASIGERKLWAKWIYEEPPLVNIEEDHDWWRGGICRPVDPKYITQIIDEVNKAKKEKETAMDKNMKDYVGVLVDYITFDPPYTTIKWDDGSETRVKCVDEPYDPEKGFAMAIQKKLFGNNYYKDMKNIISLNAGYAKANRLVHIMCGEYFGYEDSTAKSEEIEKLKKENDRLLTEVNTLDAVRYGIVKANEELKKENNNLEKMLKEFSDNREELCARLTRAEMLYNNQCSVIRSLNGRIDDLKKAKESMTKKLAETKSLRQENEELKIKLEDWINSFNYQSKAMNQLRCKYIDLEKENAKYKDIVDMQKRYDELKEQYDLLTECHKRQAFAIGKQREEVEKLNKIKEILK